VFDFDAFSFDTPTALPCNSGRLAEGAGRRILIVDDEPLIIEHLQRMLGEQFDCQVASCGEHALRRVRSGERFSVVLSDLGMPGMDGVELLGKIQVEYPEIVRILITGAGDVEAAVRGLHEGAIFRFLQKPCRTADVAAALEAGILRHRRKATYRIDRERAQFAMQASEGFTALLEERLDQAQYSTVFALAKLAEERDDCTGKHLERVSQFCRELAIGLVETGHYTDLIDDRFVRDIERSAPLHDIGKVGIPDSILLKPGKLNAEEWDVMRKHPKIGAETIAAIMNANPSASFLRMGYDVALNHHEMWDGKGYGQGLSGEDIPLAARILKIADCYDALTTARPYKTPWTHEDAIGHIVKGGGTEFDPIVAATLRRIGSPINQLRIALADEVRAAS
jgi:putative two-component system response regulator